MKKVIVSAIMCLALVASGSVIAQDNKDAKKEKTEKSCCKKDKKDGEKKSCCSKDKKAEKKSCCTKDKKAA